MISLHTDETAQLPRWLQRKQLTLYQHYQHVLTRMMFDGQEAGRGEVEMTMCLCFGYMTPDQRDEVRGTWPRGLDAIIHADL